MKKKQLTVIIVMILLISCDKNNQINNTACIHTPVDTNWLNQKRVVILPDSLKNDSILLQKDAAFLRERIMKINDDAIKPSAID